MAVTLAAARRLGAIHHSLEPTGHIHLEHLITSDETMLLDEGGTQRYRDGLVTFEHWVVFGNLNKMFIAHSNWCLTSSWWYFGLFL